MQLSDSSDWSVDEIAEYLTASRIPIRLAVDEQGCPIICSVWFNFDPDSANIYCVSHENSHLVKLLKAAGCCGFEVAPNEPPYRGVRGKAEVEVLSGSAEELLNNLIEDYLGNTDSKLAKWLLGRSAKERVIRITPTWITAWDYSERM